MQCSDFENEELLKQKKQQPKKGTGTKPKPRLPRPVINRLKVYSLIIQNPSMGNGELFRISGMPHSTFESALAWLVKHDVVKKNPGRGKTKSVYLLDPKAFEKHFYDDFMRYHYPVMHKSKVRREIDRASFEIPEDKFSYEVSLDDLEAGRISAKDVEAHTSGAFKLWFTSFLTPTDDTLRNLQKAKDFSKEPTLKRILPIEEVKRIDDLRKSFFESHQNPLPAKKMYNNDTLAYKNTLRGKIELSKANLAPESTKNFIPPPPETPNCPDCKAEKSKVAFNKELNVFQCLDCGLEFPVNE